MAGTFAPPILLPPPNLGGPRLREARPEQRMTGSLAGAAPSSRVPEGHDARRKSG
jgi:hypothetical protein